jgi:hypothetical protein
MRIRPTAPHGVKRPFNPALTTVEEERHGDALDHIAHTLTAIDHNLEVLTNAITALTHALPNMLRKV